MIKKSFVPFPPMLAKHRASFGEASALVLMLTVLLVARPAYAQQPTNDPVAEAPIRMGVVGLAPRFAITNLGVDTNVFNSPGEGEQDFTFTAAPSLDLWLRTQRGLLSLTGRGELVYFNKFTNQRFLGGFGSARYEYRFNRIRPFATFSALSTRQRPGYEIDIRPRRVENTTTVGVDYRIASKSYLAISGRRQNVDYAGELLHDGQRLDEALNRTVEAVDLTWRQNLTVLTTWVVRASGERERFEVDQRRNSDSTRVMTGFELGQFALIRGNAFVGFRRLVSADGGSLPEFAGVTADVNVNYSAPSQTRLGLSVDRDVQYSFEIATPYYVQTGWTATLTQRVIGRWDVQLTGGRDRLAYEGNDLLSRADRLDHVDRVGGGIGYEFSEDARLSFDVSSYQRQSDLPNRDYKALRAGLSVSYGF